MNGVRCLVRLEGPVIGAALDIQQPPRVFECAATSCRIHYHFFSEQGASEFLALHMKNEHASQAWVAEGIDGPAYLPHVVLVETWPCACQQP